MTAASDIRAAAIESPVSTMLVATSVGEVEIGEEGEPVAVGTGSSTCLSLTVGRGISGTGGLAAGADDEADGAPGPPSRRNRTVGLGISGTVGLDDGTATREVSFFASAGDIGEPINIVWFLAWESFAEAEVSSTEVSFLA
jgi:predicted sugar kinase